jgi:hypothetical protein
MPAYKTVITAALALCAQISNDPAQARTVAATQEAAGR